MDIDIELFIDALRNSSQNEDKALLKAREDQDFYKMGSALNDIINGRIEALEDETQDELSTNEMIEEGHEAAVEAGRHKP